MNVIRFNAGTCEKVQRFLDSYISGELMVETNHEVIQHLESCADCRNDYETRLHLRDAVRTAVRATEVPADLGVRLQKRVRDHENRFRTSQWAALAAGLAAVAVGATYFSSSWGTNAFAEMDVVAQDKFISVVSTGLAPLLRVGFGDHLHCAVARKFPQGFPKQHELKPHQKLETGWEPLPQFVTKLVPARYKLILSHRCGYKNRRFTHLTFRGEGKLISLVISPKEGSESMRASELVPQLQMAGIPVYQRGVNNYQVAGFESKNYLAWVISDLDQADNLGLASALAAPVERFLDALKG
jgi:hypothetical protein